MFTHLDGVEGSEGHLIFPGNATSVMDTTRILPAAAPKFRISHPAGLTNLSCRGAAAAGEVTIPLVPQKKDSGARSGPVLGLFCLQSISG